MDNKQPNRTERTEHDCYELCQLPMASLAKLSTEKARQPLSFAAGSQSLTIQPHPDHGLPEPLDMEVYMLLLALTHEAGMAKSVCFAAAAALARLGWADTTQSYQRLRQSLERWQETTYVQEGLVRFAGKTDLAYDRIKVLQYVRYTKGARAPWSFTWTDHLYDLLQQTYHRTEVNVELYLSLKSPIAQAVYRYLCGRCWHRERYPAGHAETLVPWAQNRIGIRETYRSKVLRHLLPALDELAAVGFLARYAIEGERVVFHFPPAPVSTPAPAGRKGAVVSPSPPSRPRDEIRLMAKRDPLFAAELAALAEKEKERP